MVPNWSRGFHGYQVRPEFTQGSMNILPDNPHRPDNYALSVCYTHPEVPGFSDAFNAASQLDTFPGQHTFVEE